MTAALGHPDRAVIDLATRIQRRRDFTAHAAGFLAGVTTLAGLHAAGLRGPTELAAVALVWATALSFQHFRHVLRGPVTPSDVTAEAERLAARS
ncbi:MAG TPA: hypothetical protein VLR26_07560 [Frankiaceae bacterium]|nr:hypothetical protein [Frankiaceae bacterium]